jgi:hypothetical protein
MDIQLQLMLKQAIEAFQAQKFDNAALVLKKNFTGRLEKSPSTAHTRTS